MATFRPVGAVKYGSAFDMFTAALAHEAKGRHCKLEGPLDHIPAAAAGMVPPSGLLWKLRVFEVER